MQSPIEIRTLAGVRLDVSPSATMEINMGGISLLSLADRTATYSNSFKLPRTPTNEAVLTFSSHPENNTRPSIDVLITKGLFQKQAVLKVVSFEKDYSCSVSYADIVMLDDIKKKTVTDFLGAVDTIANNITITQMITALSNDTTQRYKNLIGIHNDGSDPVNYLLASSTANDKTLFVSVYSLFYEIANDYNLTLSGSLLSDPDFLKLYLNMPSSYITKTLFSAPDGYTFKVNNFSKINVADVLKEVAYLFMSNCVITNNEIIFNKIDTTVSGINLEGFKHSKLFQFDLAYKNTINYTLNSAITDLTTGSDYFISNAGVDEKELIKLKAYLPSGNGTKFEFLNDTNINDNSIFFSVPVNAGTLNVEWELNFVSVANCQHASMFNLAGYYSSILNPIFANPVILDATRWIDPLTADSIMNTRVINSVQLGGRYWIDSMAYNLATGQSKMKLIKL